jgi:hypothetical protein
MVEDLQLLPAKTTLTTGNPLRSTVNSQGGMHQPKGSRNGNLVHIGRELEALLRVGNHEGRTTMTTPGEKTSTLLPHWSGLECGVEAAHGGSAVDKV